MRYMLVRALVIVGLCHIAHISRRQTLVPCQIVIGTAIQVDQLDLYRTPHNGLVVVSAVAVDPHPRHRLQQRHHHQRHRPYFCH